MIRKSGIRFSEKIMLHSNAASPESITTGQAESAPSRNRTGGDGFKSSRERMTPIRLFDERADVDMAAATRELAA
jgi:hypothetical protein